MPDLTIADIADKIVVVTNPSELSDEIDSTVSYMIDGIIDMGGASITVPTGGITFSGIASSVSGLIDSTNNHTMFIDDSGNSNPSGSVFLNNMFITVNGTNSKVHDLDNDENGGVIEHKDFNYVDCTSLGELTAFRQGLADDAALVDCKDGFTMSGTWSGGFALLTFIIVKTPSGTDFTGTVLKEGTDLIINGSIRSDMNALALHSSGEICDFQPSNITNDTEFLMNGVRVNKLSNSFPNMPASSVKAKFSNCVGTENTHIGGQWTISSTATTTIASANTPVKLAGTTTYVDLQHYSGAASNAIKYIGTDTSDIAFSGVLPLIGTNNNVVNIKARQWDDSESSYIELSQSGGVTMNAGGRAEGVSIQGTARLDNNDRIEMWVENQTSSSNITADLGGLVVFSER